MTITKYISRAGVSTVGIPDRIKGKPVTAIGNSAFAWCGGFTSVTLSRRTRVGRDAFPKRAQLAYRD
jgi:hypothetical protein